MSPHLRKIEDNLSAELRKCIHARLQSAARNEPVCAQDLARAAAHDLQCSWQDLMRPVRTVIAQMAHAGILEVLQNDHPVDILEARGPVVIRARQQRFRSS